MCMCMLDKIDTGEVYSWGEGGPHTIAPAPPPISERAGMYHFASLIHSPCPCHYLMCWCLYG
jgi:hypothetical protein